MTIIRPFRVLTVVAFVAVSAMEAGAQTPPAPSPSTAVPRELVTTPSGLQYVITRRGTGPQPRPGQVIVIHYALTLPDGSLWWNTRDPKQRSFVSEGYGVTIGAEEGITKGLAEALRLLRVGDQATVIIPPQLAYGNRTLGRIPANATLRYEVEVIGVKGRHLGNELRAAIDSGGVEAARRLYAAAKATGFADYYVSQGSLLGAAASYTRGHFAEAAALYTILAEQYPDALNGHVGLCYVLEQQGQHALAAPSCERAGEIMRATIRAGEDTAAAYGDLWGERQRALQPLRTALQEGMAAARARGDTAVLRWFMREEDKIAFAQRGIALPGFLQVPPPMFRVGTGDRVRAYVIGDWGTDEPRQFRVAAAVQRAHTMNPFQFGLTTGDNFYESGIDDPASPRWQTSYEATYGALGVPLHPTFGNHDFIGDAVAAEILYTQRSRTWKMPSEMYTYRAGPVQFFAVNTNRLDATLVAWLTVELAKSTAPWRVLYGHHPLNTGPSTYGLDSATTARLVRTLGARVQLMLAGHHHSLQHTVPVQGIEQFIVGGGGTQPAEQTNQDQPPRFVHLENGFGIVEADSGRLTVSLVDADGKPLYSHTLTRTPGAMR